MVTYLAICACIGAGWGFYGCEPENVGASIVGGAFIGAMVGWFAMAAGAIVTAFTAVAIILF